MIITKEYVDQQRQHAYGHTVYRCCLCGWQGWGAPASMHGFERAPGVWGYTVDTRHRLEPLEAFVGHEQETFHS